MSFSFFKKEKHTDNRPFLFLGTDMHSHLLPGIDDGSPDISTSIQLIKGFYALGYKKIITTPHILWELYPNTPEIISAKTEEVRKAIADEGINLEFHAAAEYFIDDHFTGQLKAKAPLLTLSGNMVLVEFSMITPPLDLNETLFEMQMQDYQPVLAHPERYTQMFRKKDFFDDLKTSGCLFQLNLLSLTGYYGEPVQQLADHLLKKNYYDFAGTDLHHSRHLSLLQKIPSFQLKKLAGSGAIKNHLI